MARFERPSGGTFAAIGRDSCAELAGSVSPASCRSAQFAHLVALVDAAEGAQRLHPELGRVEHAHNLLISAADKLEPLVGRGEGDGCERVAVNLRAAELCSVARVLAAGQSATRGKGSKRTVPRLNGLAANLSPPGRMQSRRHVGAASQRRSLDQHAPDSRRVKTRASERRTSR